MKTDITKTRAITAAFPSMVINIVTGTIVVAAGSRLFTQEAMKMEMPVSAEYSGVFTSLLLSGTTVLAGQIIGYFTATHEE